LEIRLALYPLQCFRHGQTFEHAMPLTGVPVPHEIEAVPADIVLASEGCIELRFQRRGVIRAVAREEPILVAEPSDLDGNWIVEPARGTHLGRNRGRSTSAISLSQAAVIAAFSAGGGLLPPRPPTFIQTRFATAAP
jgi:hypothetical protein